MQQSLTQMEGSKISCFQIQKQSLLPQQISQKDEINSCSSFSSFSLQSEKQRKNQYLQQQFLSESHSQQQIPSALKDFFSENPHEIQLKKESSNLEAFSELTIGTKAQNSAVNSQGNEQCESIPSSDQILPLSFNPKDAHLKNKNEFSSENHLEADNFSFENQLLKTLESSSLAHNKDQDINCEKNQQKKLPQNSEQNIEAESCLWDDEQNSKIQYYKVFKQMNPQDSFFEQSTISQKISIPNLPISDSCFPSLLCEQILEEGNTSLCEEKFSLEPQMNEEEKYGEKDYVSSLFNTNSRGRQCNQKVNTHNQNLKISQSLTQFTNPLATFSIKESFKPQLNASVSPQRNGVQLNDCLFKKNQIEEEIEVQENTKNQQEQDCFISKEESAIEKTVRHVQQDSKSIKLGDDTFIQKITHQQDKFTAKKLSPKMNVSCEDFFSSMKENAKEEESQKEDYIDNKRFQNSYKCISEDFSGLPSCAKLHEGYGYNQDIESESAAIEQKENTTQTLIFKLQQQNPQQFMMQYDHLPFFQQQQQGLQQYINQEYVYGLPQPNYYSGYQQGYLINYNNHNEDMPENQEDQKLQQGRIYQMNPMCHLGYENNDEKKNCSCFSHHSIFEIEEDSNIGQASETIQDTYDSEVEFKEKKQTNPNKENIRGKSKKEVKNTKMMPLTKLRKLKNNKQISEKNEDNSPLLEINKDSKLTNPSQTNEELVSMQKKEKMPWDKEEDSKKQKKNKVKQINKNGLEDGIIKENELDSKNFKSLLEEQSNKVEDFPRRKASSSSSQQSSFLKNKFDTKNLVKNFLNQFLSFVISPEEESVVSNLVKENSNMGLEEYQEKLKLFFKHKKFNRALLKEFIHLIYYRNVFCYFLENRANDWISFGRMKDKQSHLRALSNFIYICNNHNEIKSWRFRYNFV